MSDNELRSSESIGSISTWQRYARDRLPTPQCAGQFGTMRKKAVLLRTNVTLITELTVERHIRHSGLSDRDKRTALALLRNATAEVRDLQLIEFDF